MDVTYDVQNNSIWLAPWAGALSSVRGRLYDYSLDGHLLGTLALANSQAPALTDARLCESNCGLDLQSHNPAVHLSQGCVRSNVRIFVDPCYTHKLLIRYE
jgi:hypothetical protein